MTTPTTPVTGDVLFGRYRVVAPIATAGQATVLLGERTADGVLVVAKLLHTPNSSPGYAQELARAERAAKLRFHHPNVVDPIESGDHCGQFCTVFLYVPGSDLAACLMAHGGALPLRRSAELLRGIAGGLEAIHRHDVIHRDIKAENIIVDPKGAPRIIDFGIARRAREGTVTTGRGLLGTPSTMSPEQFDDPHSVDHRSDLYSAGVVFFECLTGQPPWIPGPGQDPREAAHSRRPAPPSAFNSSVSLEADQLCLKMLQSKPEARIQTAREVREACEAILGIHQLQAGCQSGSSAPCCLACGSILMNRAACPGCRRLFGSVKHRLVMRSGPAAGRVYQIPQGSFVIGREQIAKDDPHMSRRQLSVECRNGTVMVANAASLNPSSIDDRPIVQPQPLIPGTRVRLGVHWATYL